MPIIKEVMDRSYGLLQGPQRGHQEPVRHWPKEQEAKLCRYYNSDIRKACFVLPQFARAALEAPEESK
ncbi:hypothetical protein EC968_000846 [Mortierella alpina]|nr:hypothetical protein EC968_000846 [Mortierella alpina]